jgi:hypothetical protein
MDRAERALCWRPFVLPIGQIDALKLNVVHHIEAYLTKKCGHSSNKTEITCCKVYCTSMFDGLQPA